MFLKKRIVEQNGRIRFLEGLRGVAALIVVIDHLVYTFYPSALWGQEYEFHYPVELLISSSPLVLLFSGNLAVVIFFMLSGFVLSYKFLQTKNRAVLVSGMIKRYFRLTVPVVFSCMVAYFLMKTGLFFNSGLTEITHSEWISGVYEFEPDFFMVFYDSLAGVYLTKSLYNPVLWTVRYELFGSYMVFLSLFTFLIFPKKYQVYLFYAVLCLFLVFVDKLLFICFPVGVILADLFISNRLLCTENRFCRLLILTLALYLCSYPYISDVGGTIWGVLNVDFLNWLKGDGQQNFYLIIGSSLLVYLIINSYRLQNVFCHGFAIFLGKISFSMYIIHFLIISSFTCFVFRSLLTFLPYDLCALVASASTIPLTLVVSLHVHKYVDMGGIKFSKFILAKVEPLGESVYLWMLKKKE